MQHFKLMGAIAAGAVLAGGAACAQPAAFRAEAKLATPVSAPATMTVSGLNWSCTGDTCVGVAEHASLDNPVKECRKAAAALGPFIAYTTHGRELSAGTVKACNVAVAQKAGVAETAQK
jgi:hypothetical protein